MTPPDRRSDRGFTLPEVLISMVVLVTIATVMTGVVSVVLRSSPDAEARAEDARSVLGLVTWLPQDVDSTPPTGFDTDPLVASGCGIDPDGEQRWNLLRMEWSERTGAVPERYVAAYHYVNGVSAGRIVRVTCSGPAGTELVDGAELNLTADLPRLPADWQAGRPPAAVTIARDPASADVVNVALGLTLIDGDVIDIDAAPKNPADTLPTTTVVNWIPPAPEPWTNSAPVFEDRTVEARPGVTTQVTLAATDVDGDAIELTVTDRPAGWTVTLSGAVLSIRPTVPTSYPSLGTVSVLADDLAGGTDVGTVAVTVVAPDTPTTTSTTTTTTSTTTTTTTSTTIPICHVLSATISPSPVKNVQQDSSNQGGGSVDVGVLARPVTVTVQTDDQCAGLEVRYATGGVNSPPQVGMTQTGPTSWKVTLPGRDEGSSETWADGDHPIRFFDADGGPWGSVVLKVT